MPEWFNEIETALALKEIGFDNATPANLGDFPTVWIHRAILRTSTRNKWINTKGVQTVRIV